MKKEQEFVIQDGGFLETGNLSGCVVVPDGVRVLESFVFEKKELVTGITLPDSVEEIGHGYFWAAPR